MANTETPTTPQAPMTPTTVTITQTNGATFSADLHNLSAADADKLYEALGRTGTKLDYRELADQVAGFSHNFKSIISVGLPAGMDWQQAMTNFMRALKEGGGAINKEKDQYLKDLEASSLGQSIIQSGLYKTAAGTAAAIGMAARFGSGLLKPFETAGALLDATTGTAGDIYDQIGFGMSSEQAKAIGTAYAAALYSKVDAPSVRQEANMLDKAIAGVETGLGHVWHMLPPAVTAYFTAIGKWLSNGFNWSAAYAEAFAEAKVAHETTPLTYEQTLERNMIAKADKASRPEAAVMMRQSENIAGVETAPIADIIEHGGVYRDTGGTFQTLQFQQGAPVATTLKDDQGQPLTLTNRTADRWKAVVDAVVPDSVAEGVGEVGAVALIAKIETRFAPLRGMWNATMRLGGGALKLPVNLALGVAAGLSQGTAKVAGWVLPSSAGSEAAVLAKAVDKAGDDAATAAAKLAKKQSLAGEALENMVAEAREAARAKAALALDPRGTVSKALDFARPAGDKVRAASTVINGGLEATSRFFSDAVDSVRSYWSFDRTTPAQKAALEAKLAAEAAMGNVSQETINAAKAAKANTVLGKLGGFFGDIKDLISLPKFLGGGTKVAREIAEGGEAVADVVAKGAGRAFRGARFLAKGVPLVGVVVIGGEMVFASGAHAESVEGVTLGFREQLVKDYIVGRISPAQYVTYKNLQDYYMLTGLGGIVTAGVVEGVQGVAGELIDKASVTRYLPATIVDTVRTLNGTEMPDIAPQQTTQLLTASERLARIQEVQQENVMKLDKLDSRAVMQIALGGVNPQSSSLNSTIDWDRVLRSVGEVPPAPDKPVTAVNTASPLTPEQLLASHETVIAQARMAVNRGSAPAKLDGFNLGTGFAAVHSTGAGAATRTPPMPDSSSAQTSAGLFAVGA